MIGNLNLGNESFPTIDISAWQSTCDLSNMSLIDAEPGTAIPIYDLIIDSNKRQALKNAIENYMRENSYIDFGDPTPLYRYTFDNNVWRKFDGRVKPTTDYYYMTDYSEYGKGNAGYTLDKIV
ncbi:MAG: hypothetical protein LUE99_01730 [Bacteroides sp.]|nr:hypothetical protein [Bacteroides sp.]